MKLLTSEEKETCLTRIEEDYLYHLTTTRRERTLDSNYCYLLASSLSYWIEKRVSRPLVVYKFFNEVRSSNRLRTVWIEFLRTQEKQELYECAVAYFTMLVDVCLTVELEQIVSLEILSHNQRRLALRGSNNVLGISFSIPFSNSREKLWCLLEDHFSDFSSDLLKSLQQERSKK